MPSIETLLENMSHNPKDVRFRDLKKVCDYYFGKCRIKGSHHYYSVPWEGEPLINIQDDHGRAKSYQVRQVLVAVSMIKGMGNE